MLEDEYQLDFFSENGFVRKQCSKCGSHFWTRDTERATCGDAPCDPYSFIGNPVFEPPVNCIQGFFLPRFLRNTGFVPT